MRTIPLRVDENGGSVPLRVEGDEAVAFAQEEVRIIEAVSPTADVARVEGGVEITVRDLRGDHSATIYDGPPGDDYVLTDADRAEIARRAASEAIQDMRVSATLNPVGIASVGKFVNPETGAVELRFGIPQGEPGVSPEIYVHDIPGGHRVMIIRADGTYVPVDVMDGGQGPTGPQGVPGPEGVSPVVAVTDIAGGHRVTITDAGGTRAFDVMDGANYYGYGDRVTSLSGPALANGTVIEAVGVPEYVDDVSRYAAYGISEPGWYVFARIAARAGVTVTAATEITGDAGHIATVGADRVDVAVRFGVTAASQTVTVTWAGGDAETFVFTAPDLAIRNLDYRTTFYIYDIADYATWEYALTADATFAEDKKYYTESGGVYTLAEVTAGEAVPAGAYYNHSKLRFEGMTKNVTYRLDEMVDCPIEIVLPVIPENGHGAWFEIQLRYNAAYSCTLLPPEGVKIGTATSQSQTAGVNTIDLQYTDAGDVKMWTLLNTHSNIPT